MTRRPSAPIVNAPLRTAVPAAPTVAKPTVDKRGKRGRSETRAEGRRAAPFKQNHKGEQSHKKAKPPTAPGEKPGKHGKHGGGPGDQGGGPGDQGGGHGRRGGK